MGGIDITPWSWAPLGQFDVTDALMAATTYDDTRTLSGTPNDDAASCGDRFVASATDPGARPHPGDPDDDESPDDPVAIDHEQRVAFPGLLRYSPQRERGLFEGPIERLLDPCRALIGWNRSSDIHDAPLVEHALRPRPEPAA
jgi:hypothetical protein